MSRSTRRDRRGGSRRFAYPLRRWIGPLVVLFVSACDGGPQGPGALLARASLEGASGGPSLGAVVLELQGSGIQGFEARGDTRLYASAVPGKVDVHRVVLVHPSGGDLGFEILVDDVGMDRPRVTVVQAADTDNAILERQTVVVRIEG
jgi:hypothetical protein